MKSPQEMEMSIREEIYNNKRSLFNDSAQIIKIMRMHEKDVLPWLQGYINRNFYE